MFMLKHAAEPPPRYQTIRGAHWTARKLSPWLRTLLRQCDAPVTLADLAHTTHLSVEYMQQVVDYLRRHALMKSIGPER